MTKNTFVDRKSITKNMNKLFVLLVIFSMTSCAEQQISRTLKNFRASTITIPEDLQKIHRRSQTTIEGCDTGTPVMIIYHDSLECSSCRISHLIDFLDLYELSDSLGTFKVMTIFSPLEYEYDDVLSKLIVNNFEYPIYIDFSGTFRQQNKSIPEDRRFHRFLINSAGLPVFVGDPKASDQMWTLFLKSLEDIGKDCQE